ncbi:unknown [Bacteroides sp. CAG:462]|nr:unknown [Bacteroides sp. CAG:462]
MFRTKDLIEFNQMPVHPLVQKRLVLPDIKPCISQTIFGGFNCFGCNLLIEKIGFIGRELPVTKLGEPFDEFLVRIKDPLELLRIKNKELVNIGDNELLQLDIFLFNTLPKVIQQQFLQCLLIQIIFSNHLSSICRHLYFNNDTNRMLYAVAQMNRTINTPIRTHLIALSIKG